jgi:alginate O-acetyltransferase complex protein AlgI
MQFNSYSYLLFLALAVILFWRLPVSWRRVYVLALSLLFYASWSIAFLLLPLSICAITYFCASRMRRSPQNKRFWLWLGIAAVLSGLAFFKYSAFLLQNLKPLLPGGVPAIAALVLPLGISFYTFEAVSYLLDVRQGRVSSTSFVDLCLFVLFWPHLIAGPIVRFRELAPQLRFDRPFERESVIRGLDRLVLGLVQKNLFANSLAGWVDDGFLPRVAHLNTFLDNWCLAAAFGLQIYFDFAAYSNMAIGAAQLIGVRLPENFRCPYHAQNPVEFWSRWHMTLSRWIRDYLFFPINARHKGAPLPLYTSLMGVMALVGLWHGAGWGFVLWGTLHGAYLVAYRVFETLQKTRFASVASSRPVALGWRLATLAAVTAAWVPFRAATLDQAWSMLRTMVASPSLAFSYSVNFYLATSLLCLFCLLEPYLERIVSGLDQFMCRHQPLMLGNHLAFRPLLYAVGLLLFMIFDDRDTQFIYFQF